MRNRPTAPRGTRQVAVERHSHQGAAPRSVICDPVRVTVLGQADAAAVLAMVGRCSATTLYRRFHGVTDGVRYTQQLLADAADHDSYAAWNADCCVGIGNLHVCDDTAEIGVLVEDGWHLARRGPRPGGSARPPGPATSNGLPTSRPAGRKPLRPPSAGQPRTAANAVGSRQPHRAHRHPARVPTRHQSHRTHETARAGRPSTTRAGMKASSRLSEAAPYTAPARRHCATKREPRDNHPHKG